jgi:hypothetical protein
MPLYMYQAAYTAESLATQLKKPENRVEAVGRAACEAVGGKLVGGWYCFGDYDLTIIADVRTMRAWLPSRRPLPQEAPSSLPSDRADDRGRGSSGYEEDGRGSKGLQAGPIVGLVANALRKNNFH